MHPAICLLIGSSTWLVIQCSIKTGSLLTWGGVVIGRGSLEDLKPTQHTKYLIPSSMIHHEYSWCMMSIRGSMDYPWLSMDCPGIIHGCSPGSVRLSSEHGYAPVRASIYIHIYTYVLVCFCVYRYSYQAPRDEGCPIPRLRAWGVFVFIDTVTKNLGIAYWKSSFMWVSLTCNCFLDAIAVSRQSTNIPNLSCLFCLSTGWYRRAEAFAPLSSLGFVLWPPSLLGCGGRPIP